MSLKNILAEFQNKVLPLYGMVSIVLVITDFITGLKNINLAEILLATYIFVTLIYYVNNKIFARYINMNGDKIIFYIIHIIETSVFGFILRTVIDLRKYGEICFHCSISVVLYIIIGMSVSCTIIFFAQKSYCKRVNQKLDEYKQKNNDDNA